jgi:uncharacterized protein YbjQ (UPF0145 family)
MAGAGAESAAKATATDLSPEDAILARASGFDLLGPLTSASVYHTPWVLPTGIAGTAVALPVGEALNHARSLVLGRLATAAERRGADVVVGVRVDRRWYRWVEDVVEFTATGVAMRSRGAWPGARPALAAVPVAGFCSLVEAGFLPAGIATGAAVYYLTSSKGTKMLVRRPLDGWPNIEVAELTSAHTEARRIASARAGDMARSMGADGVVGLDLEVLPRLFGPDSERRRRGDLQITVYATGTAIADCGYRGMPPVYAAASLGARD